MKPSSALASRVRLIAMGAALCAVAGASSCAVAPLRTIGPETVALPAGLGLNVQLPRGDIEIFSDLPENAGQATAELEIKDAGASGFTLTPVRAENVELRFAASDRGLSAMVGYAEGVDSEQAVNLSYSLTLHLPEGYEWISGGAQTPNAVNTGWGEIMIHGLKGSSTEAQGRYFEFWAGNPMDSFSSPDMLIENVEGRIQASSWGDLTMRNCTEIMLAMSDGPTDIDILGPGGSLMNYLEAGGPLTLRVRTDTNLSFYNEFVKIGGVQEAFWTVNNQGRPAIKGPEDVTFEFLPYSLVYTGTGGSDYSAYRVSSSGGSITYRLLD
jgi:hypothetical protein